MIIKMKPVSQIEARLGIDPDGRASRAFAEICKAHMDKYVPKRNGFLRGSARIVNNTDIWYNEQYAHYIYMGKKYVMDNGKSAYYSPTYGFWSKPGVPKHDSGEKLTIKDGFSKWDKHMWSAEKDECLKELRNYIGGNK